MLVLRCGQAPVPPSLSGQPRLDTDQVPTTPQLKEMLRQAGAAGRIAVCGTDAGFAAVLTRLMRADSLDIELAYVPDSPTPATSANRLAHGSAAAELALHAAARPTPFLRDDAGRAVVGAVEWLGPDGKPLQGQVYADSTHVHTGEVSRISVRPTLADPGLRVATSRRHGILRRRRWFAARATQYGGPGVIVVRDGEPGPRAVTRSSIYRHVQPMLLVREGD